MKIAIIGSRTFNDYQFLKETLSEYKDIDIIVSGGATGADSLSERYAKENNIQTLIFKPNWDKYGKRAGYLRNIEIVDNSDLVIAFWDGKSQGTKHSLQYAKKQGVPVKILNFTPTSVKIKIYKGL